MQAGVPNARSANIRLINRRNSLSTAALCSPREKTERNRGAFQLENANGIEVLDRSLHIRAAISLRTE